MTRPLNGLSELAGRYDVLLSDVWGVIHNGVEPYPAACEALTRWQAGHGQVVLISNAARPWPEVAAQLDEIGVPRGAWSALVTSGDVTRDVLAARAPGPVYRIGPERSAPLYANLGLGFADDLNEAAFICCTGPNDDDVETPEDYRDLLTRAAARRLPFVCANPDKIVQRGDRLIYCGGALADLYETLGGETVMAGKPHAPIYDACYARAAELLGRPVNRAGVLAIGDGLPTDAQGANAQGLDLLFVAGGIHGAELVRPGGALDVAATDDLLAASGLHAAYAMAGLAW
jgi:HAD superfamily hydrolase (TIGR01459 family)